MKKRLTPMAVFYALLGLLALTYLIGKSLVVGTDINVYLYASKQLFRGENIYADNPYNLYLYSPLFAGLLGLISWMDWGLARVIWLLLNVGLAYRIWILLQHMLISWPELKPAYRRGFGWAILFISFGFLNHNFNLGQITVLILWLSLEGTWRVLQGQPIRGAALLALGINIKILPLFFGFYLFTKGKFKASVYTAIFTGITLMLPALWFGWNHNSELLGHWQERITPSGDQYVFEKTNGCQSLNCLMAAYLYDFPESELSHAYEANRKLARIPQDTLVIVLQCSRLALLLSIIPLVLFKRRQRLNPKVYLIYELAYVSLVTVLVFPHQMKYAMLYTVPAGAYLIRYFFTVLSSGEKLRPDEAALGLFIASILLVLALIGRDIVGDQIVNTLDYYHYMGLVNLVFLIMLWTFRPNRIIAG